jgi:hypothetical protein
MIIKPPTSFAERERVSDSYNLMNEALFATTESLAYLIHSCVKADVFEKFNPRQENHNRHDVHVLKNSR